MCLVNSIVSSFSLFFLSFFKMPSSVVRRVVSMQRNFLLGGEEGKKKVAWLSWENGCKPKSLGGLDIKNIGLFNFALLAKWRWEFCREGDGLWKRVLISNMMVRGGLGALEGIRSLQSIWWRDLVKVCGGSKMIPSGLTNCRMEGGRWG